jgi:hypothetical protein
MSAAVSNEPVLIDPLVAKLMEASMAQTHAVTDQVIESLTYRAKRAEVERDLIREMVSDLLDGPWMPTPDALRHALWPSRETVDAVLGEKEGC